MAQVIPEEMNEPVHKAPRTDSPVSDRLRPKSCSGSAITESNEKGAKSPSDLKSTGYFESSASTTGRVLRSLETASARETASSGSRTSDAEGCKEHAEDDMESAASTPKRRRTNSSPYETDGFQDSQKSGPGFEVGLLEQSDSQPHPSSPSVSTISETAQERLASGSDENDADYSIDSSPTYRNPTNRTARGTRAKEYSDRRSYSSLLNNLRVCGNEILRDLGGSISGPEEDCERPATAGSELTTAAYNNFVRRIVDDTLDRTVTFCEQPRHAITTLESICAKAWPRMEMKRHRNRIRAYLKACRRNSKKNKGQINMKEAPMNGLSIEARQLVSNALNLVADDVDQLKMMINRELNKSRSTSSHNSNNKISPNTTNDNTPKQECSARPLSSNMSTGLGRTNPGYGSTLTESNPNLLLDPYGPQAEVVSSLSMGDKYAHRNPIGRRTDGLMPTQPGCGLNPFFNGMPGTETQYDATYMAAMLRLLPTMLQFTNPTVTPNLTSPKLSLNPLSSLGSSLNLIDHFNNHVQSSNPIESNYPLGVQTYSGTNPPNMTNGFGFSNSGCTMPCGNMDHSYETPRTDRKSEIVRPSGKEFDAPPAHLSSAQYSPTLNEATGKLLDVRILTQDDIAYFRHNLELSREAIKYAKGVARLIMKKAELLEGQLNFPINGMHLNPMNLS